MTDLSNLSNFIWGTADLIRDTFKRGKYQDVILPFTVLRRIDCVLDETRDKVRETNARFGSTLTDPAPHLRRAAGHSFYNTSLYTFSRLLEDYPNLASNLRAYINGFSQNMREVIEKFDFENTIKRLDEEGLLFQVMERFAGIDLHPNKVPNHVMGSVFEELIRRFNEALNENLGEHFTPRDVIRLMRLITLAKDTQALTPGIVRKIYDPCCGTGGILMTAKENILKENPAAQVWIYGQEVNPETFAICKSDLYIKSETGDDAERIYYGSTLSNDRLPGEHFHHIYANPPYGKDWKRDEQAVSTEAKKGALGRFEAGLPRINDGQLLFLQHMLSHMYDPSQDTSHVAIVMNSSPLFTGDAGSGESEIRRWILENDWLEAIIALPEQLFYNTRIATYIWILTNRKSEARKGKVQLINATDLWVPMGKYVGDKRRLIAPEKAEQIRDLFVNFTENERSKIFSSEAFGYRKILVEHPLRLNFQLSSDRVKRLRQQKAFQDLSVSKKKQPEERRIEEQAGRELQGQILTALSLPATPLNDRPLSQETIYKDRMLFEQVLNVILKAANLSLSQAVYKAILTALSERDESAEICRDEKGYPQPDPNLSVVEVVPYIRDDPEEIFIFHGQKILVTRSILEFFKRTILSEKQDAWISDRIRDSKDGQVGAVGYTFDFSAVVLSTEQYKIQEQTKKLGIKSAPLSEFSVAINFVNQSEDRGFYEYSNAVYIPLYDLEDAFAILNPLVSKNPSYYAQVVLHPDKAIASYFAQFLNQDIGRLIRSSLLTSSHRERREHILRKKIAQLPVYLPERDMQSGTIEVDTKITNIISELRTLQELVWSRPRQLKHVASRINNFKREERFSDWLDSLPFPLASILWLYYTLGKDYKRKYETLLHFFEALSELMATILLSCFMSEDRLFQEKCRALREILPSGSLERATFGSWVKIFEYLAKEGRTMLHGNIESQKSCMELFQTRDCEILEMLFSSEIVTILQETNADRNKWTGHGGIASPGDNHDRHTLLENQLLKLRNIFTTKWDQYILIKPGINKYASGIYNYRVERIMGRSLPPFEEIEVQTNLPMEDNNLYLRGMGELKPLKLLPLIKITKNACYFYNRQQPGVFRFVSYHFEENSEISESLNGINKELKVVLDNLSKSDNN